MDRQRIEGGLKRDTGTTREKAGQRLVIATWKRGRAMINETLRRALPRDVADYRERQAAHYRALAEAATTPAIKDRLLREAEEHERLAEE